MVLMTLSGVEIEITGGFLMFFSIASQIFQVSKYLTNRSLRILAYSALLSPVLKLHQPRYNASYPKSLAEIYTCPHLDTVAGDALFRFSTSKTSLHCSVIGIRSPLARVRILLSSRTVFRFSIQMASTGPSQVSHTFDLEFLWLHFCQRVEKTPGIQSSEI